MQDEYYKPGEIRYTKEQIKFLIPLLPLLHSGFYPPSPTESGYTDASISKRHIKKQAGFVISAEIYAELTLRIQSTGLDGLLLEFLYSQDSTDEQAVIQHIAQCLRTTDEDIHFRIQTALRYCSGNCRRSIGCDKCLSLSRCMRKETFRKRKGRTYHRFLKERKSYLKRRERMRFEKLVNL